MQFPRPYRSRSAAVIGVFAAAVAAVLAIGGTADAAIVPTVPMGTSADFSALAASTVTNTGPSVLDSSVGVSPGPAVTGFPPGLVLPPATFHVANADRRRRRRPICGSPT